MATERAAFKETRRRAVKPLARHRDATTGDDRQRRCADAADAVGDGAQRRRVISCRMTDELSALIEIERIGLSEMLLTMATARETAPEAETDPRYIAAADSIRLIAATMDKVDDAMLVKLASVNETSEGGLSSLIAAHLVEVGFARCRSMRMRGSSSSH